MATGQPADGSGGRPPAGFYLPPAAALHDTGWGHLDHQGRLRSLASTVGRDMIAMHGRVEQEEPSPAELSTLARVHAPEYLDRVREASLRAERAEAVVHTEAGIPVSGATWDALLGSSGAVCHAIDQVADGARANAFVAARPPGHQAFPDRGSGFSLVNHVAVGARHALAAGRARRIAIIDWDLHHGRALQEIFWEDPDVFYLSVHEAPRFPASGGVSERGAGPGHGTTLNVPLPPGTGFPAYRKAFRGALERMTAGFTPDLVLVCAGYDALKGDPLGSFELDPPDFHELTRMVMDHVADTADGRVVAVLEGGYSPRPTGAAVAATVRALAGIEPGHVPVE